MRVLIFSLVLLGCALSGSAFAEFTDPNMINSPVVNQTNSGNRVTAPKSDAPVVGIQDPAPAIYEPGRTDANYGSGDSDSSSSSSDDYSSYTSGD